MTTTSLPRPSETPWLTIIVHDTPRPSGWLDTLDLIIEACSTPAALNRSEVLFEHREEVNL